MSNFGTQGLASRPKPRSTTISLIAQKEMRRIANQYSDPYRAFREMRRSLRCTMNTRSTMARINYHQDLVKHKVGNKEVEMMARRTIYGSLDGNTRVRPLRRERRMEEEVVRILEGWEEGERRELRRRAQEEEEATRAVYRMVREVQLIPQAAQTKDQLVQRFHSMVAKVDSVECSVV